MRGNNGTSKTVASVETDSVTACGTIHFDFSGIWGEPLCRVFGGNTTLKGKAAGRDVILRKAELLERRAGGDLDLSGYNVDTGDFLGNGVFDLAERNVSIASLVRWFEVAYILGFISIK